jgi:hypothetical protein
MANSNPQLERHLYWLEEGDFLWAKDWLREQGYKLAVARLTPCQVLRATDKRVYYAPPALWSFMCRRQGSWYRKSKRRGQYMMMSEERLPTAMDRFRDAALSLSDFQSDQVPNDEEMAQVVASAEYQDSKPTAWEKVGALDAMIYKAFFTVNRVWGRGDNFDKHWVGHKANHANFLAKRFTTELDGEEVPYTLTGNDGVCSSCAEFFNVLAPDTRKLVRSCPGSITFGKAPRNHFVDVNPVRNKE